MSNVRYINLAARLAANSVESSHVPAGLDCPCRLWLGSLNRPNGYPRFAKRVNGKVRSVYAHRAAKEIEIGSPIPEGFDVDHLCVTSQCIEPRHLEIVTPEENQRRKLARINAERNALALAA